MRRHVFSVVVALLTVSSLLARQQPDTRGLAVVPAPVGANGALQELYAGSYALIIGVSRYDSPAAWAPLESIPQELDSLATSLRQLGFQQVDVVRDPTGSELKQSVEEFMRRYGYKPDTRLLFFFAGHGYTLDGGSRGYFVPRDAPDPVADEAGFRATALPMQQVSTWAGELVARHALFAFDSCFSGTIFRTRNRVQPARITELTQKPVRQFLAAGGAGETVPARSVFTPMFIRGLTGAADLDADGYLTGTELFNYVQREVIAYGTGQTPQFGTVRDPRYDEGDLVFVVPKSPIASARAPAPAAPAAPGKPSGPVTPRRTEAAPTAASTAISTDVARRALASRSIPWTAASVASALASADSEVLELFVKGGAEPGLLLEGLGSSASDGKTAAITFFERARGNPRATQWLASALAAGVDPNATVKGSYYKREGLLNAAVRAGNAPAILALLDAGASPHSFQELWFTRYANARFLDPYGPIIEHDVLSPEEKKSIIERFITLGAMLPDPGSIRSKTYHTEALEKARAELKNRLGLSPPSATHPGAQPKTLCQALSKRDGTIDWCGVVEKLPVRVASQFSRGFYHDFYEMNILGLMTVVDRKAYLLGVEPERGLIGNLAVVEISSDGRKWDVVRYMRPGAGMGHCLKDENGHQPENCWRRISMSYHPEKKQMMVVDYYPYDVSFAGQK